MASDELARAVEGALRGDLASFAELVEATQAMAYAVAHRVLKSEADARDATQDAYLLAFRRLHELREPRAFAGWLRRIVIATAENARRRARATWIGLDEQALPPVLDDDEARWSTEQQRQLARAVLTLSEPERRLCELHYHGGWSLERLARDQGVEATAMRKRLQRVRDKLKKEIEMEEQRLFVSSPLPRDLPLRITELLARPRLVDLPENPVGAVLAELRRVFVEFVELPLAEVIDLAEAERRLGGDAVYIEREKLQRIEGERVLRYDLTLPLLLAVRWTGTPFYLNAAGKVYRRELESSTHLEAFHQFELFAINEHAAFDVWSMAGRILKAVDHVLPRVEVRVTPTEYPMCRRAFSLDVFNQESWVEVLAWGEYADWVLRGIGADPARQGAYGVGMGLERLAALKYGIDDIRKMANSVV